MKLEKKHYVIAGVLGVATSVAVGAAYLQYKRMMNYVIKLGSVKVKTLTSKVLSMDIVLNFTNKASIDIVILKNITNVYVNNKFITKVEAKSDFTIKAEDTSKIPLNIELNPQKVIDTIGGNISDILLNPSKINIRVDVNLKAKLWFFTVPIKDSYSFSLKEITSPKKEVE